MDALYFLWNFWMWCATINLALLLAHDVIHNSWSKPRDYALYVCWGPVSLAVTVKALIEKGLEKFSKKKG